MSDGRDRQQLASRSPLGGRRVLVLGPESPLTRGLERSACARGAIASLARTGTLGSEGDADQVFDDAIARFPEPDAVILVVATDTVGALDTLTVDDWQVRATQPLRQVFWLARRVVEGFLADAVDGRLVLVVDPASGGEANEIVEGGLRSFAFTFVREYGRRGLSCNVVLAASRATGEIVSSQVDAVIEQSLFLASPAASFVSGETVTVAPGTWRGSDA